MEQTSRKIISASMIVGLVSAILILIGILIPMIDLSAFHEKIEIRYNLFKVCKNVGLISPTWYGIPYGILIGVVAMLILSFVDIPLLKLVPSLIVLAMMLIMLIDSGNIVEWARDMIEYYFKDGVIVVDNANIWKSFTMGVYFIAAGVITGIVSCFCPGRKAI